MAALLRHQKQEIQCIAVMRCKAPGTEDFKHKPPYRMVQKQGVLETCCGNWELEIN